MNQTRKRQWWGLLILLVYFSQGASFPSVSPMQQYSPSIEITDNFMSICTVFISKVYFQEKGLTQSAGLTGTSQLQWPPQEEVQVQQIWGLVWGHKGVCTATPPCPGNTSQGRRRGREDRGKRKSKWARGKWKRKWGQGIGSGGEGEEGREKEGGRRGGTHLLCVQTTWALQGSYSSRHCQALGYQCLLPGNKVRYFSRLQQCIHCVRDMKSPLNKGYTVSHTQTCG